jgi:transcriptional regulator with XRE-family HTH domain
VKQADIADQIGMPRPTLGRYWNEQRSMSLNDVEQIFHALGTSYAAEADEIRRLMAAED